MSVAVLGGGPAGLLAALLLARRGTDVVVLERATQVGGMAASFEVAGVRVDHGSHRLHLATDPALLALLHELLGADLQRRPRRGRMRLAERWVGFPPDPIELVRRLPPRLAAALARDVVTSGRRPPPHADTFTEVVRAGVGPTLAALLYEPYVRKLWGLPPEHLSGELARRRVSARSARALLRKLSLPGRRGTGGFFYPRRGFGEIVERLADAAVAAGAEVRTGWEVRGIELESDGARVYGPDGAHVDASTVWSTLPVTVLPRIVAGVPEPVVAAARRLRSRALCLVYLLLPTSRYTPYDAHYVPGPEAPFVRVSEPKAYRDAPGDDPADRTVLCAEVPCAPGDALDDASDEELGALVVEGLARVGLPDARPVEVVSRHVPSAYPVYDVGYERSVALLDDWISDLPALVSFGRQGLFAHDNTHHAMTTAWAAVRAADARGRLDTRAWAVARASFRAHVVED